MAASSIDLRQKILRACERHLGSQRTIADIFGVSLGFVEKVLRQYRTTGAIAPKARAGGQKLRLDARRPGGRPAVDGGPSGCHPGGVVHERGR